ncbi:cyclic di-AMP binding protein CbpA [Fervidibacillus albus]|uniref:Cyclic di-AMP binding protein CbpA n=1 Tax=Fervidibacillus albus TaxID=2980026 RepID=A0A9E8RUM5_9BACI|nr:cyclic di-AMP binding protein CbpA [Fervidibacillus albus]WAA09750.1 cyclic di-AMP binding protein CbpA [Fervidibacillus albus]
MQIRNHFVKKSLVKYVTEDYTIQQAREHLEKTGFRCVPILDKSETKFLGNVYEIDTYKYEGSLDDSVLNIADNKDAIIHEEEPFFRVFFTIRKLPFLAVLDENDQFIGILTHSSVMDVAEDAFAVHRKGYAFTIGTFDFDHTLARLTKVVSHYTPIQSLITLHSKNFVRQIVFTIPETTDEKTVQKLRNALIEEDFKIVHEEKLS